MSKEVKRISVKKINKIPLILNHKIIWKKKLIPFEGNVKVLPASFQDDLIYDSKTEDFVGGDVRVLRIVNRLNKTNNTCRTIATCKTQSGVFIERTSDEISKLIGQGNYNTLFSSLCSIINHDLKIRGIFSLLTEPKTTSTASCQWEGLKPIDRSQVVELSHMHSQTDESYIACYLKKVKTRQRNNKRNQLAPYVIPDASQTECAKTTKVVITPDHYRKILKRGDSEKNKSQKVDSDLPELGTVFTEDSNSSIGGLSINTTSELMLNPMSILANVDKVTEQTPNINSTDVNYKLHNLDSAKDTYPNKPAPINQVLHGMPQEQRIKMLLQQGLNDWKNCMTRDESGHLPIHIAVLNNDLDLLKRQCLVLKMRGISVDIPADNLTPLRMSLYQDNVEMTALLLQHNADPFDSDTQDKTCFHIAAETATDHLQALVNHCQHNARKILEENEELWKPEYSTKSDEDLATILMHHIGKLFDADGYTPLMLASKSGRYENIKLLVESCPKSVNMKMRSSGNTPLYLAISSACMDSTERGNKSKVVDHFRKSIEILVEHGADPNLPNFNGNTVNDLLTDYNIGDLSMLVANKLTCRNINEGQIPPCTNSFEAFMLVKDKNGKVDIEKLEKSHKRIPHVIQPAKKSPPIKNVAYTPQKTSPKPTLIVKSETITGKSLLAPLTVNRYDTGKKPNLVKNMKVQNFTMDKPLVLKAVVSKNKRKLEMTVETPSKKSNTNG